MYTRVSHTLESVIQSLESFIHLLCDVLCFVYACLTQALEWELLALKHAVAMCRDLYHINILKLDHVVQLMLFPNYSHYTNLLDKRDGDGYIHHKFCPLI